MIKERWPEVKVIVLTIRASYRADALAASADTLQTYHKRIQNDCHQRM